jgi:hypothetical protein
VASQLPASGAVLSSIELLLLLLLYITKLPVIASLLNYFLYIFVYKIFLSSLILISLTAMLS